MALEGEGAVQSVEKEAVPSRWAARASKLKRKKRDPGAKPPERSIALSPYAKRYSHLPTRQELNFD